MSLLEGDAKNILCHYTGVNGLIGILGERKMRFSHFLFLNDQKEFRFLNNSRVKEAIREDFAEFIQKEYILGEDDFSKVPSLKKIIDYGLNQDVDSVLDKLLNGMHFVDSYIASFCYNEVALESDKLSMWKYYGEGSGYCILFNKER